MGKEEGKKSLPKTAAQVADMILYSYHLADTGSEFYLNIGRILKIEEGQWELCIKNIHMKFKDRTESFFATVSSNFVRQPGIKEGRVIEEETPIYDFYLSAVQRNSIRNISIKSRDFFRINNAEQTLTITFTRLDGGDNNIFRSIDTCITILLRRIS